MPQVLPRLKVLIGEVCAVNVAEVSTSGRLRGYGLDSVRILELVLAIESEFKVQLAMEGLQNISTVGDLADHIDRLLRGRS